MRKRGTAVTGDMFSVEHPTLDLSEPFSSRVDVLFDGVTHQVLTTAGQSAFSYEHTTGEFAVGELKGHIVEYIDTVRAQAVHRHQAILGTDHGALSVHGYDGVERLLDLVAALRPTPTRLGVTIDPDDGVEVTTTVRAALATQVGLLEISPLTQTTNRELPQWQGTQVHGGELYRGILADESPYLTLVSPTARAVLMPSPEVDIDKITRLVTELSVHWTV